jgi:hypothetical protein
MFNIFLLKKKGRGSKFALPRQLRTSIKTISKKGVEGVWFYRLHRMTEINKYRKHQTKPEGRR